MQSEGLLTKVVNFVFCNGYCSDLCEKCFGDKEAATSSTTRTKRLSKSDIQYVINHQPISRLESTASQTSSASTFSALPSPGYGRERVDSENSSSSLTGSRKGSTSSSEYRRSNPTPVIDMKPIEFWAANREAIQPRTPKRRLPSESEISVDDLKPDLYEKIQKDDDDD